MLPLIILLAFATTLLLTHTIVAALTGRRQLILQRFKTFTAEQQEIAPSTILSGKRPAQSWRGIGERLGSLAPKKLVAQWQKELTEAGIYMRGEEFAFLSGAAGIVGLVLTYLLTHGLLGGLIGLYAGSITPITLLRRYKRQRIERMAAQLPEAISTLANSLKAGFSFLQAFDLCAKEMAAPISIEFGRVMKEINVGLTTEQALQALTTRVPNEDIDMMVTAVLIQRETGGNLAEILDNISETIRERIRIKGEIRTLTAQGRLSGIIIGFLPVAIAVIISLLSPDYLAPLIANPIGMLLILMAIVSEGIGIMVIRKIVDIKV